MKAKAQLQRWLLLIRKIQSHPYLSYEELQRELEEELVKHGYEPNCSLKTLKRDVTELRNEFYVNIRYSRSRKGLFIDAAEYMATDIESLLEPFELLNALNADGGVPDFIYPEKHRPRGTQHLCPLIHAIKHRLKINFRYLKYSDYSYSQRTLSPYALKEVRTRWYVIGREESGAVKTFGLDRMDELEITANHFSKDASVDIAQKFFSSYGIYSADEYPIEDVVLGFDAEDGGYLKSVPLHPSQEVVSENAEEVVIKLRIRLSPDFLMEILSRSWSLRVIQPESLRRQVCDIYKKALHINKEAVSH